ncbi:MULTISPECIES: OsmC family protein [unclassified Streptomyces]|uniref:OsmC family protein n=2 Tax=Streptomyces TaxID=1883 RepID=UPI00073C8B28|nr:MULTISPECIES: OsmC family protein [unclassified Streptomyces]ODA72718.1 OsmC-like protein [Streptomyces sp. AVP053U2]
MKMETRCGRTVDVTRSASRGLPTPVGRVVVNTSCAPHDEGEPGVSLTAGEARDLAGLLLSQAAAVDPEPVGRPGVAEAVPTGGDAFEIRIRGHVLTVDPPLSGGGRDTAPAPVELFVAAVTSCAAHYAGRYLDRHGVGRDGLSVRAEFAMADEGPPRVGSLALTVLAPALPPQRLAALRAVVPHCTVTNTLAQAPDVVLEVRCGFGRVAAEDTEAGSA